VPPVKLEGQFISKIRAEMPEMPGKLRQDLSSSGLSQRQIESILDDYKIARTYITALQEAGDREVSKVWSQGVTNNRKLREAMAKGLKGQMLRSSLAAANATVSGEINSNQFSQSLEEIILNKKTWEELGLKQVSDESEIEKIVAEVIADNNAAAEDVRNGELKAIGFLVGQVMQKSGGQANPALAQKIIKKQLNIS
jgi:aspartyl-tRNA(Asn)/glutamyl-tRNA(Gln) amidotransferase subunit B